METTKKGLFRDYFKDSFLHAELSKGQQTLSNPKPETLNPKPLTLNPKPLTLSP